jgi:hypothetical protein
LHDAAPSSALDADPFGGRTPRRASKRRLGVAWLAAVVVLGVGLHVSVAILGRLDEPSRAVAELWPQDTMTDVEMPPGGDGELFSAAEIRWCLREDIRVNVLQQRLAHSHPQRFNRLVREYNRRCTRFAYRDDDLRQARRDVDDARESIVAEALAEAQAVVADEPAAPGYSALARDVQELLSALGYNPGPVDGHNGAKTKAAAAAFERDLGRAPSGRLSEALRSELLERVRTANVAAARLFEATPAERAAIGERCGGAAGIVDYNRCVETQFESLAREPRQARAVSEAENALIAEVCARARLRDGEPGYDRCVGEQVADLARLEDTPSLAALTDDERSAVAATCDSIGSFYGPAAFYRCAEERLAASPELPARSQVASGDAPDAAGLR